MEIFKLFGSIFVDSDEANKSISKTDKNAEGLGKKLGAGIKTAAKFGVALGAAGVAAGAAMLGVANKAAGATDRIDKLSQKIGISRQGFQEWEFILSQSGTDIEKMQNGLKTLVQRMDESVQGTGEGSEAFKRLGLSALDSAGNLKSQEQMFEETVTALQKLPEGAEKSRLAFEMFGRAGTELMPMLNGASGSVEDMKKQAHDLGLILSDDAVDAGVAYTDMMDQLKRSFQSVVTQVGVAVMPILQRFGGWLIDNMPLIQKIISTTFKVFEIVISTAVNWIQSLISWLSDWFSNNEKTMTGIRDTIVNVFQNVVTFLQEAWSTIRAFWEEHGEAIITNVSATFSSIWDTVQTVFNAVKNIIQTVLDLAVPFIQEKLAVIQRFWEENGQQIMQAVQNAFAFIKSVIDFIMPAVLWLIEDVWGAIKNIINGSLSFIMGLIKTFAGLFTGDFSKMWEGIKQTFSGALESIWGLLQIGFLGKIFKVIKGFGTKAMDAVSGMVSNVTGKFNSLKSSATSIFDGVKTAITTPIDKAKSTVENAINAIKDLFSKLKLKFPKIDMPSMPKISMTGSLNPTKWITEGLPKLKVAWNALGGIFTQPTIFNTENAGLQGVGEAGPEAILPLTDSVLGAIGRAIANTMRDFNQSQNITINPAPVMLDGQTLTEIIFEIIDRMNYDTLQLKTLMNGGEV